MPAEPSRSDRHVILLHCVGSPGSCEQAVQMGEAKQRIPTCTCFDTAPGTCRSASDCSSVRWAKQHEQRDAHPVAVAAKNEGEVVSHAQQLPKVDATLLRLHSQLMHQGHGALNALLVVGRNHDLCTLVMAYLDQLI